MKDPLAVELGRRGGLKGGIARSLKLSAQRRKEIAKNAALVRWGKPIKIYQPPNCRILICEGCRRSDEGYKNGVWSGWLGSGESNITITAKGNPRMAWWCPPCYEIMKKNR